MLMRSLRRQLSLRFEPRSLVFVDDDSQKLYDRWEEREVWAFVPTLRDPNYDIEGIGRVSPREISWIQRADAFSLEIAVGVREAALGTLMMLQNRIEATLAEGQISPDYLFHTTLKRLSDVARDAGLEQVFLPFDSEHGVALAYSDGVYFRGGIEIALHNGRLCVSPFDKLAGISAGERDECSSIVSASPQPDASHGFHVHNSSLVALHAMRTWIDASLKNADVRRTGMPKYDVAISFAGEDRGIAEDISAKLTLRGYRVFYDAYEQADLWGKDLYQHLASVYTDQATFCVILISHHYRDKLWTKHELRSAQARAFRESREYILPVALDDTLLPGVPETVGYLKLSEIGTDELVELLCEKLEESS
jgi:hypothetical protein